MLAFSLKLAGPLAGFYLLGCLTLYAAQTRLIFRPAATLRVTPDRLGVAAEDVWLEVRDADGGCVHGWWLPNPAPDAPALLYLHGNGGNIGSNLSRAIGFRDLGFSVLVIDYRGYGRSSGPAPNEARVYADAAAAWDYLAARYAPGDIFLYGHSLGGAIAIELARRQPHLAGAIVESTFTALRDMGADSPLYRLFPVDWLLTQHFDSRAKVPHLQVPLLFVHGTADAIVPARMSGELHAIAPDPKRLLLVPGAGHINVPVVGGTTYLDAVREFVAAHHGRQLDPTLSQLPPVVRE